MPTPSKPISLDRGMRDFFSYTNALRQRGHGNPHGGEIWKGSQRFSINDNGLDELQEFAGAWGLKISQIAKGYETEIDAMTLIQAAEFDGLTIDWTIRDATIGTVTVTDWTAPQLGDAWLDDTVQQNP